MRRLPPNETPSSLNSHWTRMRAKQASTIDYTALNRFLTSNMSQASVSTQFAGRLRPKRESSRHERFRRQVERRIGKPRMGPVPMSMLRIPDTIRSCCALGSRWMAYIHNGEDAWRRPGRHRLRRNVSIQTCSPEDYGSGGPYHCSQDRKPRESACPCSADGLGILERLSDPPAECKVEQIYL